MSDARKRLEDAIGAYFDFLFEQKEKASQAAHNEFKRDMTEFAQNVKDKFRLLPEPQRSLWEADCDRLLKALD